MPASSAGCCLPLGCALGCGQRSVLRRWLRARLAGAVLLWEFFRQVPVQVGVLLLGFLFLLLVPCFVRPGVGAGALPASSPEWRLPFVLSRGVGVSKCGALGRQLRARLAVLCGCLLWFPRPRS